MNPLELRRVSFTYEDGTQALDSISVSLSKGEKVAVIGPNGAGKSTLLHLVAGFRMPFEGSVKVSGEELTAKNSDSLRRRIGILFQDPDDQIFMPTVREDVAFGPRNLGMDDVEGRTKNALESVGIGHLSERVPHRLSHGMKKRVAIAGVVAMETDILLLDEPTSGLDPKSRNDLIELLKDMKTTMLIATHDIEAAAEISNRAVLLNVAIIGEGSVREIVGAHQSLVGCGMEPPSISTVFRRFQPNNWTRNPPPVTVDEAVEELRRLTTDGVADCAKGPRKPRAGSSTNDISSGG